MGRIQAEHGDLVAYDGRWWRKVERQAKEGEVILATDVYMNVTYERGDVLRVFRRFEYRNDGVVAARDSTHMCKLFDVEYVVLEPLPPITPQLSGIERQDTLRGAMESLGDACKDLAWRLLSQDVRLMYARGRLATAEDEKAMLSGRFKSAMDALDTAVLDVGDYESAAGRAQQIASLVEQMAHWSKEIDKWGEEVAQIEREERAATHRSA